MDHKDLNQFVVNYDNFALKNEYFLFDSEDIELSYLRRSLEEFIRSSKFSEKDRSEAEGYFAEMNLVFETADFSEYSFPYLKSILSPPFEKIKRNLDNPNKKAYFLILFFSTLKRVRTRLYKFYQQSIKTHNFGLPKTVEGMVNPDLFDSSHYNILIERVTNWYVKNEFITFFLHFLNDYFDSKIPFDEKGFSIDGNYEMSMKIFMKKSFFKLSGYLLSKLSGFSKNFFLNRAMAVINTSQLAFLLLSSFTYGISLKNVKEIDLKPLGFIAGFFLNYLINYTADALERHSNTIEIENMIGISTLNLEILGKLNKKVEKIRSALFDLIKAHIAESIEIDPKGKEKLQGNMQSNH